MLGTSGLLSSRLGLAYSHGIPVVNPKLLLQTMQRQVPRITNLFVRFVAFLMHGSSYPLHIPDYFQSRTGRVLNTYLHGIID